MASWTLAIDYGTTSSAAAIANGSVSLVEVGGAPRVPSVVLATEDGSLLAGEVAVRQGAAAPDRLERTPKRRLGDRLVVLGEHQFAPVDLAAAVLRVLAEEAIRQQGGERPAEVRLTHPAAWAGTRLGLLRQAAERAGLHDVTFVPEPVAAALHYAGDRLAEGELVAVYDLGGGTFDTAVLRRSGESFELVGPPGGSDRLGGEDFDERLYQHVGAALAAQDPDVWEQLRFSDERTWLRANSALRAEVRAAKEALSGTSDYTIYVPAPVDREVQVTREELERLIAPDIERTIEELVATVSRSGVAPADLAGVYLVGGSSRIPLVTRLLAERMGTVPVTWGDPKAVVVLGAAAAPAAATASVGAPVATAQDDTAVQSGVEVTGPAAGAASDPDPTGELDLGSAGAASAAAAATSGPGATAPPPDSGGAPGGDATAPVALAAAAGGGGSDVAPVPEPSRDGGRGRGRLVLAAAAVVVLVALVGSFLAFRGEEGGAEVDTGEGTTSTAEVTTTTVEEGEPVVEFDPEGDGELAAARTFSYGEDGDRFLNSTLLRNTTAGTITKIWFEVVPKELATTTAEVTWSIQPTGIVVEDPVVYFQIELGAGDELLLTWETALPDGAEADQGLLDEMAAAHRVAVEAAKPAIDAKTMELAAEGAEVVQPEQPDVDGGGTTTGGPTGGTTGDTTGGPTGGTTGGTTPTTSNSPPSILVSNQSNDERATVDVTVPVSDPEGDPVTVTITGLPKGISASGYRITGTIAHDAVSETAHKNSVVAKPFAVTVVARDSKGAQTMKQFTWTVRDTHLTMPNYVGKYGCGTCEPGGLPDVAALAAYTFGCAATTNTADHDRIAAQSVASGSIVRWGQAITFTYWRPSC